MDRYRSFKFKVKWDGRYVAGVSKVSGFTRSSTVISHRSGGDPSVMRTAPGQTSYEPITLERGVTHDIEFEQWANKVWDYANSAALGEEVALKDFRKNITIELFNIADQKVLAYHVYQCWPSEYVPLPELDASANGVAIQSLTLQNEGWERDKSVSESTEPRFTLPADGHG